MTKNDKAWKSIFEKYDIPSKVRDIGFYTITSAAINEFREARLMAKIDHRSQLPKIFKENNLSILPTRRGEYIIGPFEIFHNLNDSQADKIIRKDFPENLVTLSPGNIFSESASINCAYLTGMISDIAGEQVLPTLMGRMSTGEFSFKLGVHDTQYLSISVINSQCEIDACFEGPDSIILVEAKNIQSDDFNIRQLYYPFRLLMNISIKKIIPVFLVFSNDIFYFYIFSFQDYKIFNSIKLEKILRFSLGQETISYDDIIAIIKKTPDREEPRLPFPQADRFERVMDLVKLLNINNLTEEDITQNYDFDPRQTQYYTRGGMYMGLINKTGPYYHLTDFSRKIQKLKVKDRNLKIIGRMLQHRPFKETLKLYLEKSSPPEKEKIVDIMKHSKLHNVSSESTYRRRAQTILKWVEWIINLQE